MLDGFPSDWAPDTNALFAEVARRSPPPRRTLGPVPHSMRRVIASRRERRTKRKATPKTSAGDGDDPAPTHGAPNEPAREQSGTREDEARPACESEGAPEALTEPEKRLLTALAQMAVQAAVQDRAMRTEDEEQQSNERNEP